MLEKLVQEELKHGIAVEDQAMQSAAVRKRASCIENSAAFSFDEPQPSHLNFRGLSEYGQTSVSFTVSFFPDSRSLPRSRKPQKASSMSQPTVPRPVEYGTGFTDLRGKNEAYSSGISWPAVIGGAFTAAALSLILITLGTGLGFSSVSPWSNMGVSTSTVKAGAIIWLVFTQIIAFAMGGYLAGRLRTKWVDVHTDEVYFRDTAHGLLVWAVGVVLTAAFLASAAAAFAGRAAQRTESAQASATEASLLNPNEYLIDTLFRSTGTVTDLNAISMRAEADRIFAHALREGSMSQADNTYLARLISARTGLNEADAQRRVTDVYAQAQEAAEATRKAIAHLSLWLFVALLSGAFCASYAGTIGGRQRDHVPAL